MKQTIKLFGLLAMLAILFSCEKNSNPVTDGTATQPGSSAESNLDPSEYLLAFGAKIEELSTKLSITPSNGSVAFEDGDAVLVVTDSKSGKYVYSSGVFAPEDENQAVPVAAATAYYPYSEYSAENGTVTFTMPSYVAAGSVEDLGDKTPMAALISTGENPSATFKAIGSILSVSFNSTHEQGETITKVELSGEDVKITGSGEVSWNGDIPSVLSLNGGSSITVETNDGHLTSGTHKAFYFFLPAGGTFKNMTVKAIYGKDGGYEPYEAIQRKTDLDLVRNQIFSISKSLSGFFSGGDGSATYPYLISSVNDFNAIASLANASAAAEADKHGNGFLSSRTFFGSASVNYKQTAELDFSNAEIPAIGVYNTLPFQGTYDGDNNVLKNYKIKGTVNASAGLFEYVDGGKLKNIKIVHAQVDAPNTAGVLAGRCIGATEIDNCSLDGGQLTGHNSVGFIAHLSGNGGISVNNCTVKDFTIITAASGPDDANNQGGIVGWAGNGNPSILNCSTSGEIRFTGTASGIGRGGIIGKFDSTGEISGCTNEAFVNNSLDVNHTGGIAGILSKGTITECVSTGNVTGYGYVGGIVGGMLVNSVCVFVNKCRVDATVTGTGKDNKSPCTGGIVGTMQNGVLHACIAKGTVTSSIYDVGGIAGQVYANGASEVCNRPYIFDCIAANEVICTRASGSGNVGGVIGRLIRNKSYTNQYTAVDNCLGINPKVTSSVQYTGAFIGNVAASVATNNGYVRVRNCISLVDDSHFDVTATNNNTGGFVGSYQGALVHCYYLVSDNNQTAVSGTQAPSNLTKSDLATLTSSEFCAAHNSRAAGYYLTVNSVQYKSSGWTYYAAGPYPVPTTLFNLGEEYYK